MNSVETNRLRNELAVRAVGWRKAMEKADTGPLEIAHDVVAIVDSWNEHKAEAGNVTADAWLTRVVFRQGRGVRWWRERKEAVDTLGEAVRRSIAHDAAVYLANSVPETYRDSVKFAAMKHATTGNGTPACLATVRRLYRQQAGTRAKAKACGECERLRALLKANGIEDG